MPIDTYLDNYYAEDDIVVTVPEGIELTEGQHWTIRMISGLLSNERCLALIDDQTCIALRSDDGRYGFDYFAACVREQIEAYDYQHPDFGTRYIGGGEYALVVFDNLIRHILPEDYPEPPANLRGMGIPFESQFRQREEARAACAECRVPLAMVMPRDPVYHEEYDEKKAAWVEDDEPSEDADPTGVKRLTRILRGEDVVVTYCDVESIEYDWSDLKDEMLADLEEMELERDDEVDALDADDGTSGDSLGARIEKIEERCEHRKSVRRMAFDVLSQLEEGVAFENGEVADDIRRYYGIYVTLEAGPKIVRPLLAAQGIDPEKGIDEFASVVSELREAVESSAGGAGLDAQLAQAEQVYGLLRELLDMEESEQPVA